MLRTMDTCRLRHSRIHALRAVVACLAFAAMAGAGAQTVSLNTGGKQVRIAIGGDAALPANFPQDVALPAAATLVRVQHGAGTTILEFAAAGEPGAAITDIDARMRANGWRQAVMKPPATGSAQVWEKDQRAVIAWATPEDASPDADDVVAVARAEAAANAAAGAATGSPATPPTGTVAPADAHRVRIQLRLIARRGYLPPA